jgi:hypothetical protein
VEQQLEGHFKDLPAVNLDSSYIIEKSKNKKTIIEVYA